ncbi:hypothetical protein HPP92_027111 [Vanilla planifolia]|uniref:Chlorophyll a-b binding protein, chloroplastic n=1 Tax=Vanilla planifolia TaxID=51239 RepID=A0A835U4W7_VANPL|nr:hypothetical protein HPP92_027111 [Vanilla planifolia]
MATSLTPQASLTVPRPRFLFPSNKLSGYNPPPRRSRGVPPRCSVKFAGGQWIRSTRFGGESGGPEVVRAGGASELEVGDAWGSGMLSPRDFDKDSIINVPEPARCRNSRVLRVVVPLFVIEFILFRTWRSGDGRTSRIPGVNQDPIFKSYSLPPNEVGYPGGIFNPLNFSPSVEAKEKELANGTII